MQEDTREVKNAYTRRGCFIDIIWSSVILRDVLEQKQVQHKRSMPLEIFQKSILKRHFFILNIQTT